MYLPTVISEIDKIRVIRDDELPGGTKQRAGIPFVNEMRSFGYEHFIYASPFSGYAQVALAYVCKELGVNCTIFCERDKRSSNKRLHPFSLKAKNFGADVHVAEDLEEAESKAFEEIESKSAPVKDLWLPVGSGTLARTFLEALPERVKLHCVNVRILSNKDPRLEVIRTDPRVTFYQAPMEFHSPAIDSPKIPSNEFYDAKVWSFLKNHGKENDVWWNVAQ